MGPSSNIVVLDTNFLTIPYTHKIDVISEVKLLVPKAEIKTLACIVEELKKIKGGSLAEQIIEKNNIEVIKTKHTYADKALIEYAVENQAVVCTNDKELTKKLREKHIPVIFLRQQKKLAMNGVLQEE